MSPRQPDEIGSTTAGRRLPDGVTLRDLETNLDDRGAFTEVFREEWYASPSPVQWNVVSSRAGVLRGVHVHIRHSDYLVLASGRATIAVADLRDDSPTPDVRALVPLNGNRLQALVIPPGVAHGFLFHEPSIHIYSVSSYWDPSDELGCRWDDPELGMDWPIEKPVLSDRDAALPSLRELRAELRRGRLPVA